MWARRQPRGFGFVQFLEPRDAAEAQYYLDHSMIAGREITVVFAEENRKRPQEMRSKERFRGRPGFGSRRGILPYSLHIPFPVFSPLFINVYLFTPSVTLVQHP